MTTQEISEELSSEFITPGRLSELHMKLASEYGFVSARLVEILKVEDSIWLEMRKTIPTDKATDKAFGATEEGMSLKVYRQQLKALEKIMASVRLRIQTLAGEAQNQY